MGIAPQVPALKIESVMEFDRIIQEMHDDAEDIRVRMTDVSYAAHFAALRDNPIGRELSAALGTFGLSDDAPINANQPLMDLVLEVARLSGFSVHELRCGDRTQPLARCRQYAMWRAHRVMGFSCSRVGRFFNGRDHTTVLHACKVIEDLIGKSQDERNKD